MPSPTDQQLLDSFRNALTAIAANQSYTVNGYTYTRASLNQVWDMVKNLEQRIAAAGGNVSAGNGSVLARFGNSM